ALVRRVPRECGERLVPPSPRPGGATGARPCPRPDATPLLVRVDAPLPVHGQERDGSSCFLEIAAGIEDRDVLHGGANYVPGPRRSTQDDATNGEVIRLGRPRGEDDTGGGAADQARDLGPSRLEALASL